MKRSLVKLSLILPLIVIACSNTSVLQPPTGPGTDLPCGLQGTSCGNHMCCGRQDVCGGAPFTGCPANYCCFTGGSPDGDLRSHLPTPQVKEHKEGQ